MKEVYAELLPEKKELSEIPDFQLQLSSSENPRMLRDLSAGLINQLIVVPGIITSSSKPQLRASLLALHCASCNHKKEIIMRPGLGWTTIPRACESGKQCKLDSYMIVPEECKFINMQLLRMQENPELIPTGEIPRSYTVVCDRNLVDKIPAGGRCKIVGVLSVIQKRDTSRAAVGSKESATNTAYIKVVGIQREEAFGGKIESVLSSEDEEEIISYSKNSDIHKKIFSSIASAIFGADDIKEAIACLLFGGSPKLLPDKTRLRGDINLLLLGDPSTAKSQFLKFVERAAPIAVYTSGKGSSAAGLTASINKDQNGEFQLEGGAMVLGDGGVVCIDEFDKMKIQDRVAIHEAMEQQTISVAKAGITTVLNTRVGVLAAANPLYGRYDDLKQTADQIEFQATILSRFDMIFLVRDVKNEEADIEIAEHVIGLHMGTKGAKEAEGEIPLETLKKYVTYAKTKCFPRLTNEAAKSLENYYIADRIEVSDTKKTEGKGIPITVRQLEAIIRISEALAKMQLSTDVTKDHVSEAHRLFQVSTMTAATSGFTSVVGIPEDIRDLVLKIEDALKKRIAIGTKVSYATIQDEMTAKFNNPRAVDHAIVALIKRGEIEHLEARKLLFRKK